jgi:hypothetical protein
MFLPIVLLILIDQMFFQLYPYHGEMGYIRKSQGTPDLYYIDRGKTQLFAALPIEKKAETIRIFTFGGSSTWGLPYGAEGSFSGWLAEIIDDCHPKRHIEIVNTGYPSAPIATARDFAAASLSFQPDIFIVYSGNNEFLLENQILQEAAVSRQFIYWLRRKLKYKSFFFFHADKLYSDYFRTKQIYESSDVQFTDFLESTDARFQYELSEIIHMAHKNHIKVILCTVPCNIRDYEPMHSAWNDHLSDEGFKRANTILQEMRMAIQNQDIRSAEKAYASLCFISPGFAQATFEMAHAYLKSGLLLSARQAFIRAKEEDKALVRVKERFNAIIRAAAQKDNQKDVFLFDAQHHFNENSPDGIPGNNLFLDGMHPNLQGHFLIASGIAKILLKNKLIQTEKIDQNTFNYKDFKNKNNRVDKEAPLETIDYFIHLGRLERAEELLSEFEQENTHWQIYYNRAIICLKKRNHDCAFHEIMKACQAGTTFSDVLESTKISYPKYYDLIKSFEGEIQTVQ